MGVERKVSEKRRLQNREAQIRFRERAKRKGRSKGDSSEKSEPILEPATAVGGGKESSLETSTAASGPDASHFTIPLLQQAAGEALQIASNESNAFNASSDASLVTTLMQREKMDLSNSKDFMEFINVSDAQSLERQGEHLDYEDPDAISLMNRFLLSSTLDYAASREVGDGEEMLKNIGNSSKFSPRDGWSQGFNEILDLHSSRVREHPEKMNAIPACMGIPDTQVITPSPPRTYFEFLMQAERLPSPLMPGQLLLPRMHFIRAAEANAARLGLSFDYLHECDSVSSIGEGWLEFERGSPLSPKYDPFQALQFSKKQYEIIAFALNYPEAARLINRKIYRGTGERPLSLIRSGIKWSWHNVAENMKPTSVQVSIDHHPLIDAAFPWRSMRDKIILLKGIFFEPKELCAATIYGETASGEQAFTVWGDDPSNEMSWEISESFIHKWWFLLDSAILRQTNWWRRQRGESLIMENKII